MIERLKPISASASDLPESQFFMTAECDMAAIQDILNMARHRNPAPVAQLLGLHECLEPFVHSLIHALPFLIDPAFLRLSFPRN